MLGLSQGDQNPVKLKSFDPNLICTSKEKILDISEFKPYWLILFHILKLGK